MQLCQSNPHFAFPDTHALFTLLFGSHARSLVLSSTVQNANMQKSLHLLHGAAASL